MAGSTLLVIFGAGASYDSVAEPARHANHDWRPPLAANLFEPRPTFGEVMKRFRRALPVIGEMRSAVRRGTPVEEALQAIDERASDYDPLKTSLAAVLFYLQEVIWRCGNDWSSDSYGLTNYVVLAANLEEWRARTGSRILYVTFNYDLLLEAGCTHLTFTEPPDYIAGADTKIYKLHGSVDWGREIVGERQRHSGDSRAKLIDFVPRLDASGSYRTQRRMSEPVSRDGVRLLPAMALPTRTKSTFACPPEHVASLDEELPSVTHVLVVGWRAQEQHFLKKLGQGLHKGLPAHIVTSTTDGAIAVDEALKAAGVNLVAGRHPDGFSGYVDDLTKVRDLHELAVH